MTSNELKRRFPNASASFVRQNLAVGDPGPAAKLEYSAGAKPLAEDKAKEGSTGRIYISIISVRKRLLDPDNICAKVAIDCLRYSGIIPGDEPEKVSIQVDQRKCAKGEREETIIEITFP